MLLNDSSLPVRAINALKKAGYETVEDVNRLSVKEVFRIQGLGKKTIADILEHLESLNAKNGAAQSASRKDPAENSPLVNQDYLKLLLAVDVMSPGWTVRTEGGLKEARMSRLLDLATKSSRELLGMKNFGRTSLSEVETVLKSLDTTIGLSVSKSLSRQITDSPKSTALEQFLKAYPSKKPIFEVGKARNLPKELRENYIECYELYKREGSLQAVANVKKLTRERIRQILVKGTEYGLFSYEGREYPYVPKEKILSDYKESPNIGAVARANGISTTYLGQLLTAYRISKSALGAIRNDSKKEDCIQAFRAIENQLGHFPTTTEMQKRPVWRSLHARIGRLWGTIDNFREQYGIPKPIRTLPTKSREAFDRRKRLAFIVRMQNLDQIREYLLLNGIQSLNEVAYGCRIKPPKAYRLINLLISNEEVVRVGESSSSKYELVKR